MAQFDTAGIDAQVDWLMPLDAVGLGANAGAIRLNFVGTYLTKFIVQSLPGSPLLDYAGTTGSAGVIQPKWKSVTSTAYSVGAVEVGVNWRHIGPASDASRLTTASSTIPGVGHYDYFDLNARLRAADGIEIRFGVNNLGNRRPPQVGSAFGNTDTSTYDLLGRQYFLSARVKLL